MIRYDEHAEFQLERRRIAKEWVEQTLDAPRGRRKEGCAAILLALFAG
jgi:hypothetical protein